MAHNSNYLSEVLIVIWPSSRTHDLMLRWNQRVGRRRKMIFANVREPMSTFDHQKEWNRERRLKSRRFLIRTTFISTYIDFSMFSLTSHQPKNDQNVRQVRALACRLLNMYEFNRWPLTFWVVSGIVCFMSGNVINGWLIFFFWVFCSTSR